MNNQSLLQKKSLGQAIRLGLIAGTVSLLGAEVVPGMSGVAHAQALEEIVVTARKREETLQDVPFAVQALSGDQIQARGINSLEDLSQNVAGFSVQNLGPGQSQVSIRGISAGQIVRDQPGVKEQVGVYFDESVISLSLFTPDLDFYDMNRVEVLRGPQGTLFGSGSLSGTVRYISNQPEIGSNEGSLQLGLSSVENGDFGFDAKGAINIPLGETAAARIVAYHTEYAGFIDALQPGGGVNEDVNEGSRSGIRASLKFQPNDRLTITPRIIYQEVDMDGFNRQDAFNVLANPFTTTRPAISPGEREQYTQLQEKFEDEFLLVDAQVDYDFDNTTLTSITSYTDRDLLVLRDASALTLGVISGLLGLPRDIADAAVETLDGPLFDETTVEMFTQEIRLSSAYEGDRDFDWVIGAFYSDIDRDYGQTLPVNGFEALTGIPTAGVINPTDTLFFSRIPYNFEQIAFFGEFSYYITDQFTLTAGARYYDFEESRVLNFDGLFASQSIGVPGDTDSDGINPRIMASYDLSEGTQINAQISEGFRLGGVNDPLNTGACSPADFATFQPLEGRFDDEELTNYEIGLKTEVMGGAGVLNVSAFLADIENLQATIDAGTCSSRIVFNVPDAQATGIEFEYSANITDSFFLSAAGSYVEAEVESTLISTDTDGNTTVLGGVRDGNRLPSVPEFQLALSGTYEFQWNENWDGYFTATAQHVGSRFTQLVDQEPGVGVTGPAVANIGNPLPGATVFVEPELPSYEIYNLRLGARNETWDVALYVNNATDENALLSLDRELGGAGRFGYRVNQPRTIGLVFNMAFGQ